MAHRLSPDKGKLLENAVFLELRRRKHNIFFYKTANNLEVDFYLPDYEKQLIQVCFEIDQYNTFEREIRSITTAMDETGSRNGIILTYNTNDILERGKYKIKIMPAWKWFLD